MFLESENISINILSSHELKWENRKDLSDTRNFHAISFRILGDAEFIHNQNVSTATNGDIVFVPSYYQYTHNTGKEHLFVIHFLSEDKLPDKIKIFSPENTAYYKRAFEEFHSKWSKKQTGYKYECNSIFYKILMHIERDLEAQESHGRQDKIAEAIDYIHEHFTDLELSVHDLAKLCGMSDTYFRKLFLKHYGVSPHKFINNLKLQYAIELLNSGYYTVSEVAQRCGFDNVYYFSTFIKKETQKTPLQFINKQH